MDRQKRDEIYSKYEQWKHDFAEDAEALRELEAIEGDEEAIIDRFYTELTFQTAGMRGEIGIGTNRMNQYTVRRATCGLADYINESPGAAKRGVVIAYDSRNKSEEFAREAACTLAACGVKALLFPSLRPVPVLSFAVRYFGAIAGIVITASHNPAKYNGFKVYWEDGAQLPPGPADAVLIRIRAHSFAGCPSMSMEAAKATGLLEIVGPAVDDAYIERVKTLSILPEMLREHGRDMKIVYTPLHGSGFLPVTRVLREMGVANLLVVKEQEAPDGNFPTVKHAPNPEEPDAFALAFEMANREGADACFATDPDCDRLGVATRGPGGAFKLLTGNEIGVLLLHHILSSKRRQGTLPSNGAIVKSIVSTELARAIADDFGVKTVDTLTGFKYIAEQIQRFEDTGENTFLFGFEESYGYLSSTFVRDKDAVNASLLVTELAISLKREGKTLWDQLMEIYRQYGFAAERVKSVDQPGMDGLKRMENTMQRLREQPPASLGGLQVLAVRDYKSGLRTTALGSEKMALPASDVLYYELEQRCWVCVRPSGTEPKIKLYVNSRAASMEAAEAAAENIEKEARALLA